MNQRLEMPKDVDPQWASIIESCWHRYYITFFFFSMYVVVDKYLSISIYLYQCIWIEYIYTIFTPIDVVKYIAHVSFNKMVLIPVNRLAVQHSKNCLKSSVTCRDITICSSKRRALAPEMVPIRNYNTQLSQLWSGIFGGFFHFFIGKTLPAEAGIFGRYIRIHFAGDQKMNNSHRNGLW